MNILFINLPYSGHIIPTIGLVKELVARGNRVTYLLTPEWKNKITEAGAIFAQYDYHSKLSEQMKNASEAADKIASEYDLIIYEQFFFLGKHIAEKHSKPAVRIFTAPATNQVLMNEFISGGGFEIFRFKWACKAFTKDVSQGFKLKTDCWIDEILQNPPELNLVYTLKEFQPYAEDFPSENYKFLGASIYERKDDTTFLLPEKSKPLVYISLGTIANKAVSFYKKCIAAFKDENVAVIMSVGKNININALGKIPDNFIIEPHVPQLQILQNADIFITHGGMNSITEALHFGVPMVVIPQMADQPSNANRVEELNLGRKLDKKKITPRLLKDAVISVMNDNVISESIALISEKFHSTDANRSSADEIEHYFRHFNKK